MVAGRPSVIGKTISGNSTVLRTGTTMKASDGSDWSGWPGGPGAASGGRMARPRGRGGGSGRAPRPGPLGQPDHQAAVGDAAARRLVTARRQRDVALEAALRQ